ncbi:MAG: aminodeoxychorismate lyase [Flavobacteriaceae bacterium]|nr:aminodeoxychorismate lyase [Flavobacteriaceae bacterium]|tara:strand:+ start:23687 stop:24724 length:1038 start_codon:yes stop_codon:yes gene_type:complete
MYIKRILIFVVFSGLIFMSLFAFYIHKVMFKSNTSFNEKSIDLFIKTGSTQNQLLVQIEPYLLSVNDFDILAKRKKFHVKPGKYSLVKGMSNNDIINSLRSNNKTVNVIFNNIKNLNDLAGKISSQIEADSISILNSFKTNYFIDKGFDNLNILSMFIPNSYNFFWNTSAEQFNQRMFEEYLKFWNKSDREEKIKKLNLSKKEVMILAAIVSRESRETSELPRIAGVYLNRLYNNWKLQADPTVIFSAYNHDDYKNTIIRRVLFKHLKIDSPFNTYKYYGLPPGMISMPSIESIDAVLNYEKHNYYFFAADPRRPGFHSFARTFSEHKKNAKLYQNELSKRGIKK